MFPLVRTCDYGRTAVSYVDRVVTHAWVFADQVHRPWLGRGDRKDAHACVLHVDFVILEVRAPIEFVVEDVLELGVITRRANSDDSNTLRLVFDPRQYVCGVGASGVGEGENVLDPATLGMG